MTMQEPELRNVDTIYAVVKATTGNIVRYFRSYPDATAYSYAMGSGYFVTPVVVSEMASQPVAHPVIDEADKARPTHYEIWDNRERQVVGRYSDRVRASRRADRLDNEYGAIRYIVRAVYGPEQR